MKGNLYLFILLLTGTLFISCKKSDIEHENDFDKSYKSWMDFKTSSKNSYRYMVRTASWTGYSTETIITIQNGKVVHRSFVAKAVDPPSNAVALREEWEEVTTKLNTHQNGAATMTLDEIYQKAKTDWLLKRDNADTDFETNNNGMISACGYVENGCQDDCFRGINIAFIEVVWPAH
jgi:hypothetical protein